MHDDPLSPQPSGPSTGGGRPASAPAGGAVLSFGSRSPMIRRAYTSYLGMVIFLASWAMMFAALFFAYAVVRGRAVVWPPLDQPVLPKGLPALNTALILGSSLLLHRAARQLRRGQGAAATRGFVSTAVLGLVFLCLQLKVWVSLFQAGLTPDSGPYGSVFYGLTCFHAIHALVGLIALAWLGWKTWIGAVGPTRAMPVRLWAMYWHFVGAVWLLMFVTIYVL
jgi:cytochrome c oxidase subunit III